MKNFLPECISPVVGSCRTLAALLILALLMLVIAGPTSRLWQHETLMFDRWVLLSVRDPADYLLPIGPRWFTSFMVDITALGSIGVLALMAVGVAGYLWVVQKRSAALLILASVGSGIAVSNALKIWFLRPRPEIVPHLVQIQTASFPSGHAMNAAVAYLTLGSVLASAQGDRGVRVYIMSVAVTLTFVVGFSRIYLGVHWPTDVLAGWTMGSVWALLCSVLSHRLQRSGKSE